MRLKVLSVAFSCSKQSNAVRKERVSKRRPLTFNILKDFFSKKKCSDLIHWCEIGLIELSSNIPITLLDYLHQMRTRPKTVDLPSEALLIDINGKHSRADEFGCIPSKVSSDYSNCPDFQCALFDFVVGTSASNVPYSPDFRFSQSHCYANKQLWLNEKVVSLPIRMMPCKLNSTSIQMFPFLPFSRDANHSGINELIPSRKISWFSSESISTFCYSVHLAQSIKQTFSRPNVSICELGFEWGSVEKYI